MSEKISGIKFDPDKSIQETFDNSPYAIAIIDPHSHHARYNKQFSKLSELTHHHPLEYLKAKHDWQELTTKVAQAHNQGNNFTFQDYFDSKQEGKLQIKAISWTIVPDSQGYWQIFAAEDTGSEDRELNIHSHNAWNTDIPSIEQSRLPLVIGIADTNNLKTTNDIYGHDFGTQAIQVMVEILRACLRSGDILYRIGGDEVLLLLNNIEAEMIPVLEERISVVSDIIRFGADNAFDKHQTPSDDRVHYLHLADKFTSRINQMGLNLDAIIKPIDDSNTNSPPTSLRQLFSFSIGFGFKPALSKDDPPSKGPADLVTAKRTADKWMYAQKGQLKELQRQAKAALN